LSSGHPFLKYLYKNGRIAALLDFDDANNTFFLYDIVTNRHRVGRHILSTRQAERIYFIRTETLLSAMESHDWVLKKGSLPCPAKLK
jgi:hypothetical protein